MTDEKLVKETMVSEDTDHDDVEMEELKADIDRMIKDLIGFSPEEKAIIKKIRELLDEHELKYSYDENKPKLIGIELDMNNKPFKIFINLQNGMVIFRLSFPFRVQTNAYPLMCMFMAEFNENKAFSLLNIDPDDGELTMEYSYMLENPSQFDEKYFWVYMSSLIHSAMDIYTKVTHLSVGMVSGKEKKFYTKLLEMALETINGNFDDENVSYGTESLRVNSHPDLSHLFKEDGGEEKEDSESDDEDFMLDFIHNMRSRRSIPSFEEFMRMKEQEEDNEERSKGHTNKSVNMLSMFAKRDAVKESKDVGGDEDE